MSGAQPAGEEPAGRPDTVFFLSDYGQQDEFVGVVHAVLRRLAPEVRVIDLTHRIPPFDVRAGAAALVRALPHLGPGVVLGVVDPGVGSLRRGVAARAADPTRDLYFVGPDNGLLTPAVEAWGGCAEAVELAGRPVPAGPTGSSRPVTFDGRDVFAPAAAALCQGDALVSLGTPIAPEGLVRIPDPVWSEGRAGAWRALRSEITWVDRFGNVQLAVPGPVALASIGPGPVVLEVERPGPESGPGRPPPAVPAPGPEGRIEGVPLARAFADLEPGELGLLVDANDQLAVVLGEGSAAARLGVSAGGLVQLLW